MRFRKVHFSVMSTEKCACGKLIKENVARRIARRPLECYVCHKSRSKKKADTTRKPIPGRRWKK